MRFSLVIPVAPERNVEILDSIKKLNYPKSDFHVVVVKGKNPSENRNKGTEKSTGEIIAFLDDDAVLPSEYLKKADEFFKKYPEVDVVGGPQLTPLDEKGFAKISGYALSSKLGAAGSANRYTQNELNLNADEKSLTSANLFVRKKVMEKVKFDPTLWPGEDPKFIEDVKDSGFKVAYTPEIFMYHRRRSSPQAMMKQIFNYGRVRPKKESFITTLKQPQFLVPSFAIIYAIVFLAFAFFNHSVLNFSASFKNPFSINFLLILPFILYLILIILFSIFNSLIHKDFPTLFVLPFVYIMIHLSYGLGMIVSWFVKPVDRREVK